MAKIFLTLLATITLISCGSGQGTNKQGATTGSNARDRVEVLYFHGKQRCITCNAIESLTKEVLNNDFAKQLSDSTITFHVIDISTPEGEKIADQYEVTWSSLFINKFKDGKESRANLTEFGFSHAKNSSDLFKEGVKKQINESLK